MNPKVVASMSATNPVAMSKPVCIRAMAVAKNLSKLTMLREVSLMMIR